ncbi:MAG: FtsQ-type POTRA domain-containing protein [bacterium]
MKLLRRHNVKLQARQKKFKFFKRGLIVCLSVVALTVGLRYLSLHLENLKINSILIDGAGGSLTTGAILHQSGLSVGMPIFTVDLREVVRRLEENPWIDHVKASRRLPHTLLITLTRHEPKMILSVGKFYYVDEKGRIFKEITDRSDSMDYPIFTGLTRDEFEQDPPRGREILKEALKLLAAYDVREESKDLGLSEIHFDKTAGFSLFPEKEHFRVLVGFDGFEAKLKRLDSALQKLKKLNQSFASIDLNYEGKVILTM